MIRLTALKNANDASWVTLKAKADRYVSYTIDAYAASGCAAAHICYDYDGGGWQDALITLSLAYKMTGSTTYSAKTIAILDVMVAAGLAAEQLNSGYPSRNIAMGMAIAYDWCYDQLSPTEKLNYTTLVDTWWTWVQASGYQWVCASGECPTPYGNYFSGHFLGFGLASLAMEGDDANMLTIQAAILNNYNTYVAPAISLTGSSTSFPGPFGNINIPGGLMSGGYPMESYNYGGNTMLRLIQYMKAMQTAGKTDLFTANIPWLKQIAKNTVYEVRPDLWSVTDEGGWSGNFVRIFYYSLPYDVSGLLVGTTEGGWLTFLYNSLVSPPTPALPGSYVQTAWELFLYNQGTTPVDYTATLPTYYFSPGLDEHTIVRTDWTRSAIHTTFNGNTVTAAEDHQSKAAGHISIQRGSDYLLINAGQWAGPTGYMSAPHSVDLANWHLNTLFYWDQGTSCLSQTSSNGQYAGCQMFWGLKNDTTIKHKEGTGYVFQEAPLTNAYLSTNSLTTIRDYVRSFISILDIDFVLDRISAPPTSVRNLEWHTPALDKAPVPGIASAISVNGAVASVTLGSSKLWIDTLLPTSPTVKQVTDVQDYSGSTQMSTQHFEVSDPNASSCSMNCLFLTVLAPTASSAGSMPTTSLITASGYNGALYNDGVTPRVAMFSTDGTSHNSITYTASYSTGLTGRHVITDLAPGTYEVTKDGAAIYSGLIVGNDGSLSFITAGGATYAITQTSGPPAANAPPPPTGLGGTMR